MSVIESGEILPLSADLAICLLHQMARLMSKLSVEPCDCHTCQTFLTAEKSEEIQPTAETVAISPPPKLVLPEPPKRQSDPTRFPCEICDEKVFGCKAALAAHFQLRHGVSVDLSTFETSKSGNSQLERHQKLVNSKAMKCAQCDEVFGDKTALNDHFKSGHSHLTVGYKRKFSRNSGKVALEPEKVENDVEIYIDSNDKRLAEPKSKRKCAYADV